MRINIHAGHGASDSKSCGAIGLINESTEARKVKNEVIRLLKSRRHTVFDCTVDYPSNANDCLNKIVSKCNSNKVDLDVSIHFNSGASDRAGNGKSTGVEVYSYDASGIAFNTSKRICEKISNLGFRNRGSKINKSLYVLKNTYAPALLVECCFVDDKDDVNLYNYKTIAKAIAEGILNIKIDEPEPPAQSTATTYYRVVTNSYTNRANAEKEMNDLKMLGYSTFLDAFKKDNKSYLRVVAGSYTNRANADKLLSELKSKGYHPFIAIYKK